MSPDPNQHGSGLWVLEGTDASTFLTPELPSAECVGPRSQLLTSAMVCIRGNHENYTHIICHVPESASIHPECSPG